MDRKSSARWEGDLKGGKGSYRLGTGGCEGAYSFATRFENAAGSNPEELIAAAHAACYSMAFSNGIAKSGLVPKSVATTANVKLGMVGGGFEIVGIELDAVADVAGISTPDLQKIADDAKANCPVSKALKAVPISLTLHHTGGG